MNHGSDRTGRVIRKAIWIRKTNMNRDDSSYQLCHVWDKLLMSETGGKSVHKLRRQTSINSKFISCVIVIFCIAALVVSIRKHDVACQCSLACRRWDKPRSYLLVEVTIQAATFRTNIHITMDK